MARLRIYSACALLALSVGCEPGPIVGPGLEPPGQRVATGGGLPGEGDGRGPAAAPGDASGDGDTPADAPPIAGTPGMRPGPAAPPPPTAGSAGMGGAPATPPTMPPAPVAAPDPPGPPPPGAATPPPPADPAAPPPAIDGAAPPVFEVCEEAPVARLDTELAVVLAVAEPPVGASGDAWAPLRRGLHDFFVDAAAARLEVSLHRVSAEDAVCESTLLTLAGATSVPLGAGWLDAVAYGALPAGPLASADPLSQLSAVAHAKAGKQTATVVITGAPRPTCEEAAAGAAPLAEAAARTGHRTFVLSSEDGRLHWDAMAAAGGSTAARAVDFGDAASVTEGLRQVRNEAAGCGYGFPPSALGANPDLIAAKAVLADGSERYLDRLPAGAACEGRSAYRFDDPDVPTRIELCPALCDALPGDAAVVVVVGCPTADVAPTP